MSLERYQFQRFADPRPLTSWSGLERYIAPELEQQAFEASMALHAMVRQADPWDPNNREYPYQHGILQISGAHLLDQVSFSLPQERLRGITAFDAMRLFNMTMYNNPNLKIGAEQLIVNQLRTTNNYDSKIFDTPASQDPETVARALVANVEATFDRMVSSGREFDEYNRFSVVYVGDGNGETRIAASEQLRKNRPDIFSVLTNVCVDSGMTTRARQKKQRVEGVPEVFHADSVVNMVHIADRSLTGVVYLMEVLDDAAASHWMKVTDNGIAEVGFGWGETSWRLSERIYPQEIEFESLEQSAERTLFEYLGYGFHPMAHSVGIPVATYTPLIMAEINRVMDEGSVMVVDYSGGFLVPDRGLAYGFDHTPVRWVLMPEHAVADYVDYAMEIGDMGVTADIDPVLVEISGRWFGFKPSFVGLYASYMSQRVPGFDEPLVKGIMKTRSINLEAYAMLDVEYLIERQKRQYLRGVFSGRRKPMSRELARALNHQAAAAADKAFDPTYWSVIMDIPKYR